MCLAAGVMTRAAVFAQQPQTAPVTGGSNPAIRDVTVVGCVAPASQPSVYILDVIDDRNNPAAPPGVAVAPGTPLRLVGLPPEDFQDYVGQQVEVFGMVMPHGSSHGRRAAADHDVKTKSKLGVRYIRQLAPTCSAAAASSAAPAASGVPMAPGKNTDVALDRGPGKSRGSRNAALRRPAAPSAAPTPGVTAPSGAMMPTGTTTNATAPSATKPNTTTAAGARPVSNTSTTPGFIGTAPSNSTTANAGLGQSGISGSATLGGSFAMTPPTITFPIGRPAPGATQPPVPGSTQSPVPGSTQSPVPGATGSPMPASTLPGTSTPPAGFAQGASNTTTTNAALDQFGLSGDALLSGLVNVNVQQLLASVQVQANLNVQDVIVNLSDILNDNQIQLLVQALNTNPQAALNANDLTSALQGARRAGSESVGRRGDGQPDLREQEPYRRAAVARHHPAERNDHGDRESSRLRGWARRRRPVTGN
ncbi:MAG: hypothetical protein DMF84_09540 [Acidobacteria bacterium]|nr:MAG: hypothetical protein DMF84_09540 [Acidobacteriota bacterium]